MSHSEHKLCRHSLQEWQLFLQAWLMLLAVDLGLRLLPFQKVQGLLAPSAGPSPNQPAEELQGNLPSQEQASIHQARTILAWAARRHLYEMTCLRRSLALQWLLRRRGIQTELRIGVKRVGEQVSAHAWLEHNGDPINEPEAVTDRYIPLVRSTQNGK